MHASFLVLSLPLAAAFHVGVAPLAHARPVACSPIMQFGRGNEPTPTKEPSFMDKMTGKVQPTNSAKDAGEEEGDGKAMMQKVKDAGIAGIISYIFWEWAFWGVSAPVACFGFQAATGHWPDFSNQDDLAKLGAEAFAFVNVARFAVPLRIGLALGTTPWVQANIVDKFQKKDEA